MNIETCPVCDSFPANKVMYMGLPMLMCPDEQCVCVWGFWSWIFNIVPYNGWFVKYEGSYWRALFKWLFNNLDEEED